VFYFDGDRLMLRDEDSRNGTFIRIREPVPIVDGEVFRCGEQVLRFDLWRPVPLSAGDDGAVFCGTPVSPWHFKVTQVLGGEAEGMVYCAVERTVTLGREDCDINFNHDRYISHRHTQIDWQDGRYVLEDTGSRNGTFFRLKREVPLADGDFVFIGRQLLRVELL
jgi:pSer/pThr/pTyr-binding forkhead associated (FHA) protein